MLKKQFVIEIDRLIMSSIVITGVISLFMGGVLVIQTASNMSNPLLDKMLIGYMTREYDSGIQFDYGSIDPGRKNGVEHRFGDRHHAHITAVGRHRYDGNKQRVVRCQT